MSLNVRYTMAELFKPELQCLTPQWSEAAPANVRAFFTLRDGGVSSGPWGNADGIMGFNLAVHVGDNAGCVRMNRSILRDMLPSEPVFMKQVHGTDVLVLPDDSAVSDVTEADVEVTDRPGVVCSVLVADCLPVLLTNKEGTVVAAAHAGWRGLASGVLEAAVAKMRELAPESEGLIAWFGPHIGPEDFEVGDDVFDAFKAADPSLVENDGRTFKRDEVTGKLFCNLKALAVKRLHDLGVGVNSVYGVDISTASDEKRCYSYRRDGARSGRHGAFIWIEPEAAGAE